MLRGCRFVTLMFCFAVTGCASMPGSKPANTAPQVLQCEGPAPCSAQVTYEYWPEECLFHCEVFAPQTIDVKVSGPQAAPPQITWSLPAGTNFHFSDDGIRFEKGAASGFTCPAKNARAGQDGNQHTFTCDNAGNKADDPRGWKYWIRLEYGLAKHSLDPFVLNH